LFEFFFFAFFIIWAIVFISIIVRGIAEWSSNNASPRLSVQATIVAKRSHAHHHQNGHTHSYHITFEVESGDRMELRVPHNEFGLLVEGDVGTLTFQGTRYLSFERQY
jgi:hypothetical protein